MIEDKLNFSKWLINRTKFWLTDDIKKLCRKIRENELIDENQEGYLVDLILFQIDGLIIEYFETTIEEENDD